MNKVFLQIWEESSKNEIQPDGASLHLTTDDLKTFTNLVYKNRISDVPDSYIRTVGEFSEALISDSLYNILSEKKSIKLEEYEFNNLVGLNDIKNVE
jgi:hypothetical protein